MGIDQAVRQIDREIRTAKAALVEAQARTRRAKAAHDRAKADEDVKRMAMDRLVSANALLTGKAPSKQRGAGRPSGEDRKTYERFLAEVERMSRGTTRAELRAAVGISQATMSKYLDRAVREGRLTVSEKARRGSLVLVRNEAIIDISMRRSA